VRALERGLQSAQLMQELIGIRRRRPAAPGRLGQAVCLAQLPAQLGDALLGRKDIGVGGQHLVDDRVIGDLFDLLGEKADPQVLPGADLAAVQRHLPHDEAQKGGLARAVGADQPDAHARLDMQAGLVEQHLAAERFRDVGEVQHQTGRIAPTRPRTTPSRSRGRCGEQRPLPAEPRWPASPLRRSPM